MNRKGFSNILVVVLVLVVVAGATGYFLFPQKQEPTPTTTPITNDVLPNPDGRLKTFSCKNLLQLSESDRRLAEESKAEIIKAGISAPYFDQHFCLLVIEVASPRTRILWKHAINGYEMVFEDAWGSQNIYSKEITYAHNILQNIQPLHDVVKTVSKQDAKQLIQSCTGPNINSYLITYQPIGNLGSRLHIVASSKGIPVPDEGVELVKNASVDLESGKVYCSESKVSAGPR